jgi:primary-amine oxidase
MVVSLAHPLDPLTADELSHAVDVFRGERGLGEETRFINLELDEPEKAELRAWRNGGARPSRRAFAVLLDTASGVAAEAVADL